MHDVYCYAYNTGTLTIIILVIVAITITMIIYNYISCLLVWPVGHCFQGLHQHLRLEPRLADGQPCGAEAPKHGRFPCGRGGLWLLGPSGLTLELRSVPCVSTFKRSDSIQKVVEFSSNLRVLSRTRVVLWM